MRTLNELSQAIVELDEAGFFVKLDSEGVEIAMSEGERNNFNNPSPVPKILYAYTFLKAQGADISDANKVLLKDLALTIVQTGFGGYAQDAIDYINSLIG